MHSSDLLLVALMASMASFVTAAPPSLTFHRRQAELNVTVPKLRGQNIHLFTFGDSYTDTGFLSNLTQPNITNPMGNPDQPTPNWVHDLTNVYNSSMTFSYNYARSGATINDTIIPNNGVQSMELQVKDAFLPTTGSRQNGVNWTSADTIAGFFIGINDINICQGTPNCTVDLVVPELQQSYLNILEIVYLTGVRNFFFLNLPPLENSPYIIGSGPDAVAKWKEYSDKYNAGLVTSLASFQQNHSDITTTLYDNHQRWEQVLNNTELYGFPNATAMGDYDNDTFLWTNNFHPGQAMNQVIADALAPQLEEIFGF